MAATIFTENEINAKFNQAEARAQEWGFPELDGLYAEHEDKISPPVKEEPEEPANVAKEEISGVLGQDAIDQLISTVKKEEPVMTEPSAKPTVELKDEPAPKTPNKPEPNLSGLMDQDALDALISELAAKPASDPVEITPEPIKEPAKEIEQKPEKPTKLEKESTDELNLLGQDDIEALLRTITEQKETITQIEPEPEKLTAQVEPQPELKKPTAQVEPQPEPQKPTAQVEPQPESQKPTAQVEPQPEPQKPTAQVEPQPESQKPTAQVEPQPESQKPTAQVEPQPESQKPTAQVEPQPEKHVAQSEIYPTPEELEALLGQNNIASLDESDILAADDINASFTQKEIAIELPQKDSGLTDDTKLSELIAAKLQEQPAAKQASPEPQATTVAEQTNVKKEYYPEEADKQFDEKAFAELINIAQALQTPKPITKSKKYLKTWSILGVAATIIIFVFASFNQILSFTKQIFTDKFTSTTVVKWQKNPAPTSSIKATCRFQQKGNTVLGTLAYLNGYQIVKQQPKPTNKEVNPEFFTKSIDDYYKEKQDPQKKLNRSSYIVNRWQLSNNEPHFHVNYLSLCSKNRILIRKSLFLQHETGILKLDFTYLPNEQTDEQANEILNPTYQGWQSLEEVMLAELSQSDKNNDHPFTIDDDEKLSQSITKLYQLIQD